MPEDTQVMPGEAGREVTPERDASEPRDAATPSDKSRDGSRGGETATVPGDPATSQSQRDAAPSTQDDPEDLKLQLEETQKLLSTMKSREQQLLKEKKEEKEKRRKSQEASEALTEIQAELDSTSKERDSLSEKIAAMEAELTTYRREKRKRFKEMVGQLPERLQAHYNNPERFTEEDIRIVLDELRVATTQPKQSDALKPPRGMGTGTSAAIDAAVAGGDPDAINRAFNDFFNPAK